MQCGFNRSRHVKCDGIKSGLYKDVVILSNLIVQFTQYQMINYFEHLHPTPLPKLSYTQTSESTACHFQMALLVAQKFVTCFQNDSMKC